MTPLVCSFRRKGAVCVRRVHVYPDRLVIANQEGKEVGEYKGSREYWLAYFEREGYVEYRANVAR